MGIPLNIDWQQILLHLLNFAILACGLYFLLYKPVKSFMAKREEHYKQIDKAAEEKLASAESLESERRAQLDKLDDELREKREQEAKRLDAQRASQLDEAKAEAERIVSEAQTTARAERDRIVASAQEEIEGLAAEAAKRLVKKSMDEVYDDFFAAAGGEGDEKR